MTRGGEGSGRVGRELLDEGEDGIHKPVRLSRCLSVCGYVSERECACAWVCLCVCVCVCMRVCVCVCVCLWFCEDPVGSA